MQLLILLVEHLLVEKTEKVFVDLVLLLLKIMVLLKLLFLLLILELVLLELDPTMETMVINMKNKTLVKETQQNSGQKLRTEKTKLVLLFIILE